MQDDIEDSGRSLTDYHLSLSQSPSYTASPLLQKLQTQLSTPSLAWAVFTDIDGTYTFPYLPTDDEEAKLSRVELTELYHQKTLQFHQAAEEFSRIVSSLSLPLIAVTGRGLLDVRLGQEDGHRYTAERLPFFDAVAAAVGTELWVRQPDNTYIADPEYCDYVEKSRGFNRNQIYAICQEIISNINSTHPNCSLGFQPRDLPHNVQQFAAVTDMPLNELAAKEWQARSDLVPQKYKISLSFASDDTTAHSIQRQIKSLLTHHGYPLVHAVLSFGEHIDKDVARYNIDIVPVTKQEAVFYMKDRFSCQGIVAGDSGNDLSMLKEGEYGVIVGGHKQELEPFLSQLTPLPNTEYLHQLDKGPVYYVEPVPLKHKGPQSLLNALKILESWHDERKHVSPTQEHPSKEVV